MTSLKKTLLERLFIHFELTLAKHSQKYFRKLLRIAYTYFTYERLIYRHKVVKIHFNISMWKKITKKNLSTCVLRYTYIKTIKNIRFFSYQSRQFFGLKNVLNTLKIQ